MDYTAALFEQNRLLGELIHTADLSTPVPTCPDWTVLQLVRHVGRGDRWAAKIIRDRAEEFVDPRTVPDGKPPADPDGIVKWLRESAQTVVDAVAEVGADAPAWTFIGPQPSAWWMRRRLHEATVHRADAALALGVPYELSPALSADAISEWLELVSARSRAADPAVLNAGESLHLHATDDDLGPSGEWLIRGEDVGVRWEHGHAKGSAAVRGRAVDLMLAFLRRTPADDERLQVIGDSSVWTGWLARTPF